MRLGSFKQAVGNVLAVALIMALTTSIWVFSSKKATIDRDQALNEYRVQAHGDTELAAKTVATSFDQIYQNLRTMSLLASVRRIDRHGESLTVDGRQAIQQLYNNLASNVAVSEVYIVPADLDPDAIDPKTKQKEVPILMFDQVRLSMDASEPEAAPDPNAPEAVEDYEYDALKQLMRKLRESSWKTAAAKAEDIPFLTIGALITCDNHIYNKTRQDADRSGPIFSVPFYGEDKALKGTLSAIMLNSAVQDLLPAQNYALLDTTSGTVFGSSQGGQQVASADKAAAGLADDGLFYSEVVSVRTKDPNRPFKLWAGRPRAEFLNSAQLVDINRLEGIAHGVAGLVGLFCLGLLFMVRRAFAKAAAAEAHLQRRLNQQSTEIHAMVAEQESMRRKLEDERRQREADEAARQAAQAEKQAAVVRALATGLDRLAGGDLMFRLHERFDPAYEKLRSDFNEAMSVMRDVMSQVAGSVETIRNGSGDIHSAADDLSRRTEHQASSLEETAAALVEITATVKQTAVGAGKAREMVNSTKLDAEKSENVVRDAVAAMQGIEHSSRQIGQIIGVIDEIAFQTNLLALNAGVEAARAGDSGRGFAVVASEVRSLAQRSAEAAKEIKVLIAASAAQVDKGVALVAETGNALERIIERVVKINEIVVSIADSTNEQAAGLDQVNTAATELDQVTQQNVVMVEQSTSASAALANESKELARLVSRFKIGEEVRPARQGGASTRRAA